MAIRAEALTREFDDRCAVDAVSFVVAPGEVLGLLGPNGAGKTTLLRMLAGVLAPTRGRASIMGRDVTTDPLGAKRLLGFLSGDTALYGRLTVHEILAYFGALYGLEGPRLSERIARVASTFQLDTFLEQRADALSSGQRQRANLARAFLPDPPVLILDEPTTALDVISGRFVYEAVRRARNEDKAVLFSTHVMSEASELCDRIAILVHGRIRDLGTEAEILSATGLRSLTEIIVQRHEAPR